MKKVLLPTDFSENSKNAIHWAMQFYKNEKVTFVLMHSYFSPQSGSSAVVSINEILRKQAIDDLAKCKKDLEEKFNNTNHEIITKEIYGDVLHAVKSLTEELKNVVVVVGAKGMGAVEEIFIGSNTSALVKEADAPVFVIPQNVVFKPFQKLALAVDFKENVDPNVLQPLKEILNNSNAILKAFYVEQENGKVSTEQETTIVDYLNKQLNQNTEIIHINDEDSLAGVQNFVHSHNIDSLVTINRKKGFFERLFHKSFSKQMALHTDTPLLVLHDK
jgi:nucleotide-binding universal stress UspA family protein